MESGGESVELDMGSSYDFFGKESWPSYEDIAPEQRANRLLLRSLMLRHGFQPYEQEWWHFTLESEPYPETYFDFPISYFGQDAPSR
jgi:D-alanyl-D-alanine dipeptidase